MNETTPSSPSYHALLIGIDAYTVKPLHGCVNDIDAIQRLLCSERVGIPATSITRLASAHPGMVHQHLPGEKPATLANIRAAFEELAARTYEGDHRILIYYSGHGLRTPVKTDGVTSHREAIVPVDFNAQPGQWQLFYDFELNALLAKIVACGPAVTMILDCCHSKGVTREISRPTRTARVVCLADLGHPEPIELPAGLAAADLDREARGVAGLVDECQVITACLDHEEAQEDVDRHGVRHGLLTSALLGQLTAIPAGEELRAVPWGRIWQAIRAEVETANPVQHVWMAGNIGRAVLAGPPVDGDMGLTVQQTGSNAYTIGAGTLAGVTANAKLAVYGEKPLRLPALGSPEDLAARMGILEVQKAVLAQATARAVGAPFELPRGARGRVIEVGEPARLRCTVAPFDAATAKLLESPLVEVVKSETEATAILRKRESEDVWDLVDDIHGAHRGFPVLCSVRRDQLRLASEVMQQYYYYALPLRMAAACQDLPGKLQLDLLRCPKDRALTPAEQDGALPVIGGGSGFPYELVHGDKVAIRIRNASGYELDVALLNSAASGKVEYLGDQTISPGSSFVLWRGNTRGNPFPMTAPRDEEQGIDRLVAVGTTRLGTNLRYLELKSGFAKILDPMRGTEKALGRDLDDPEVAAAPREQWTAATAVLHCRR